MAGEFEQMYLMFSSRFQESVRVSGPPLTIFAARDTQTYSEIDPALWKARHADLVGVYRTGWEKQYALVRLDVPEDQAVNALLHEYTHSVMHANLHWMPVWLDEGLAEFFSPTRFESDRILVGVASPRIGWLQSRPLIPIDTMLAVTPGSHYYTDSTDAPMFYAEAWLMVHYMTFGPGMDSGAKLNKFVSLLQSLKDQKQAFEQVFGPEASFFQGMKQYTQQFTFTAGVMPVSKSVDTKSFTVQQLPPARIEEEIAAYQIHSSNRDTGKQHLEKALALDPNLAEAHEEKGFLDFDEGNDTDAKKEWETALKLNPALYRSLFAETMSDTPIARQTDPQLNQTRIALEHITQLQPTFAAAWVELAMVSLRQNRVQEAYNDSLHAEQLAPWRAGYHLLTGNILLRGNQAALAAQYASYVADRWPRSDHDEAVELWNQVPAAKRGSDPSPTFEIPPAAQILRGTVIKAECADGGRSWTVSLLPDGANAKPVTFAGRFPDIIGYDDTLWWGADHFSACHHLEEHPAMLVYTSTGATQNAAANQPGSQQAGQLFEVEIRDEIPAPIKAPAASSAPSTSPTDK